MKTFIYLYELILFMTKEVSNYDSASKSARQEYQLIRALEAFKTNSLTEQQAGYLTWAMTNGPDLLKGLALENLQDLMGDARDIEDKQKNQALILKHLEILQKDKYNNKKEDRLTADMINRYVSDGKARDPPKFGLKHPSEIVLDVDRKEDTNEPELSDGSERSAEPHEGERE